MLYPTRFVSLRELALFGFLLLLVWFAIVGMVVTANWGAAWIAGALAS